MEGMSLERRFPENARKIQNFNFLFPNVHSPPPGCGDENVENRIRLKRKISNEKS